MLKITALVLEVGGGVYEGNEYKSLTARVDGVLLKFKVAKTVSDLNSFVDKEVELTIDIVKGQNMSATIKVVGIE